MSQQQINFERIHPVDPNIHPEDKPRAAGQSFLVLDRLRKGPATNFELAQICIRYSARVHDLNKAGWKITSRRLGGAKWLFTLEN